jgi:hypothetical protein
MKIFKKSYATFMANISLVGALLVSCADLELDLSIPEDMTRFRPTALTAMSGEIAATLTWPASLFTNPGEVTYTVQVGTDSLFTSVVFEKSTELTSIQVSDEEVQIQTPYFARVRANGVSTAQNSAWVRTMTPFQLTGEQIFLPTLDNEIGSTSVLLRWRPTANPTRILLRDQASNQLEFMLSDADRQAASVTLEGLQPLTAYTAQIFAGQRTVGATSFVTKEQSIYDIVVSPGQNLRSILEDAPDGSFIGLEPGTYDLVDNSGAFANLRLIGKTIILHSVSGNPADTRINYREITLSESGAGIEVNGITFDGGPGTGDYLFNFVGGPANFTRVVMDNSVAVNVRLAFMRANRANNNEHKIDLIRVNNTVMRNHAVANWHVFHIDRCEFKELEITNSTFHAVGSRGFIGWATNMPMPFRPKITVTNVTINGLGSSNRNDALLDCNNNEVDFTMTNSIVANMPFEGQTVGSRLIRANPNSQVILANTNLFNLTTGGATPQDITIISYVQTSNLTNVNLGWNQSTTDFRLPSGSTLRTAATNGGPIGDLRWAF